MPASDDASDNPSSLHPPSATPTSGLRPPRREGPTESNSKTFWIWAFLMLVALLAAALPILLPHWLPKQSPPPVAAKPPSPVDSGLTTQPHKETPNSARPTEAPPAVGELITQSSSASESAAPIAKDPDRGRATEALQGYLRILARPELARAGIWGDPEWSESEQVATAGEEALKAAQYVPAANQYQRAAELLSNLIDRRQQRLQESIAAANSALEQDDSLTAIRQFELALAIDLDHQAAAEGLAQAEARPELLIYMETGRTKEKEDMLQEALTAYTTATELDSAYHAATEAVERVKARILVRAFDIAMSQALVAMRNGNLDLAESALREARRLRPEDPALQEATAQIAQKRRQHDLAQLREKAERQTSTEHWQEAEKLYRQALAIDSNTEFAKQGLQKAQDRLQLHQQLDHYLQNPDRLHSATPFDNASQLLATTSAVTNREPTLRQKVTALRELIEKTGKKVTIELQSDERTEVAIYQVGRVGRFARKTMTLRPGSYTIVGSREGYRDVRQVVEVRANAELQPIVILCTEPL